MKHKKVERKKELDRQRRRREKRRKLRAKGLLPPVGEKSKETRTPTPRKTKRSAG